MIRINASITIEAAMILPLFILIMVSFIDILNILNVSFVIQNKIDKVAREVSMTDYISERSFDSNILSSIYLRQIILDEELEKELKGQPIEDGINGIEILTSRVDDGNIEIIVRYSIGITVLPDRIFELRLIQTAWTKSFIGKSIDENASSIKNKVYITNSGEVYHTNRYCSHLLRITKYITKKEAEELYMGLEYTYCKSCLKENEDKDYYIITETGYLIHGDLDCNWLRRYVYEVGQDNCKEKELCDRCKRQ